MPNTNPDQATLHGPITPEQARVLQTTPVHKFDSANPEHVTARENSDAILHEIGAVATGRESVALVAATDEEGNETAAHFVSLDPADLGTRIESHTAEAMGLPAPVAAQDRLAAEKAARGSDTPA